ncbi:MAG: hypothetical protein MJ246_01165 [Clostridia bacterium]|nr:hypothetical protein [Clostridia bacterium]
MYKTIENAEIIRHEMEKGFINKLTLTVRSTNMNLPSYDGMLDFCKDFANVSEEDIVKVEANLKPMNMFSTMTITYRPEKLAEINKMPDGYDKLMAGLCYLNMQDDVAFITRDQDGPGYRAWDVEFKTASLRGRSTGEVVRFVTYFFHDYLKMIVGVSYEHF